MVNPISKMTGNVSDKVENAFNAVGKIHVIGMASGVLRAGVFTLKAIADVVSFIALGAFNKLRSARVVQAETLLYGTLVDRFKHRQIQNFKNMGLGIVEIVPFFGTIASGKLRTTGTQENTKSKIQTALANTSRVAGGVFGISQKALNKPQEPQAGDL